MQVSKQKKKKKKKKKKAIAFLLTSQHSGIGSHRRQQHRNRHQQSCKHFETKKKLRLEPRTSCVSAMMMMMMSSFVVDVIVIIIIVANVLPSCLGVDLFGTTIGQATTCTSAVNMGTQWNVRTGQCSLMKTSFASGSRDQSATVNTTSITWGKIPTSAVVTNVDLLVAITCQVCVDPAYEIYGPKLYHGESLS
jgi:hypothetical protein